MYTSDEAGGFTVEEMTEDEFNEMMKSMMGAGASEQYLGMLSSVEKVEELETIDSVECVKITAKLTGDALADVISATGMEEAFEGMLTSEMFADLEAANVTYWIDNEKAYIVKAEVEMSDMMSSLIDVMFAAMEEEYGEDLSSLMSISKASSVSTFGNFNAAEKFDMPEATQAADTTEGTDTIDTTEAAETTETTTDGTTETKEEESVTEAVDTTEETTNNATETTETQAQ